MGTFDFGGPPFDALTPSERDKLQGGVDIAYFKQGERLTGPDRPGEALFVILKGLVAERDGDDLLTVHGAGDCVGAMALLHGAPPHVSEAQEETIAHVLPRQLVLDLCRANPRFERFFATSLGDRLAAHAQTQQVRGMAGFMVARVQEAYLHPPLTVPASTSLRSAAVLMKEHRATSLLVEAEDGRLGVLSGSDLRDAVFIRDLAPTAPVGVCATFRTVFVEADDFLFSAQILMTRHGIRRLPVRRDGKIIGVLEMIDLLGHMSSHAHLVAQRVDRAQSIDDLAGAARALEPLVQGMNGSGVPVRDVARLVSDLSRKLQTKLFALLVAETAPDLAEGMSCLVVMGSEGRGEQLTKTDQDNALILRDGGDPVAVRGLCQRFTEAMVSFGYPLCPGAMMVSNPAWTQDETAFRHDLLGWITQPSETGFLNLAAFLDAEAVAGDVNLLAGLKNEVFERLRGNNAFLSLFARPVLAFDTPIGFFHQLVVDRSEAGGGLDVKKGGIFPVVHGVRALALEYGVTETNTFDRIKALNALGRLEDTVAADLGEALQALMTLRLARAGREGADTRIEAGALSKAQHDALRDALLVVKRFKALLSHHFHLGAF
ncbi:putative nucleotidyltransferase substrate binding domain-containing protein [Pararhodospirillum photometricum]|uniref:Cyclic nucleotide-binding domain (CNMP-BD) protein n=1 Tax=Pararhodospirillum photometricum DSM 122 TaxID=1150469 RepID=H6SQD3_PARPM|nr:putative nucleotidyltransferase substrate binding domain-containing protein [Pararhodospirillum photometricum]CCG09652.1 Cyclic nucleotide-binding domain (CNMP-BD) protein [Pararhodospirillum photometricum DSM 122]